MGRSFPALIAVQTVSTSQTCKGCGEVKPLDAFERNPSGTCKGKCRDCINAMKYEARDARNAARRDEREAREATLGDTIWTAMRRGRSLRSLEVTKEHPQSGYGIRLNSGGYISTAELSCRCIEHEAAKRAAKRCKTPAAAATAVRILEQATPTLERSRELKGLWLKGAPPLPLEALMGTEEVADDQEDDESDLMADAFGDWAPAWMQNTHHASLAA